MNQRFTWGLCWKLNLLIGTILLALMGIFIGLDLSHERQTLLAAQTRHLEELARHFAWVIGNTDDENRQRSVMDYEHAMNQNGNDGYQAFLLNARSEVIAASNPDLLGTMMDEEGLLEGSERIPSALPTQVFLRDTSQMIAMLPIVSAAGELDDGRRWQTTLILGSLQDVRRSLKISLITHIFHLLITTLAIMAAINLALSRWVLHPIRNLLSDMQRREQGEWSSDIVVETNDEMGQLIRGYNALGGSLEQTAHRLMKAEKLASVALVAVYLNRTLKKPIKRIRPMTKFLCQHNAFDSDSAHAAGRIFDQTEKISAISKKFDCDFSTLRDEMGAERSQPSMLP